MQSKPARQPTPPQSGAVLMKAGPSLIQPDVWLLHGESGPSVLKTFRERPAWVRRTVCAWLIAREVRNLRALDGIPGIPRLLARPRPWTLEMTYLDAAPLPEKRSVRTLGADFFAGLDRMINAIHARGLNHGDIRRKNILSHRSDGSPCLVDFAQCLSGGTRPNPLMRVVLREAQKIDDYKYSKLKAWYLGEDSLTAAELAAWKRPPLHLRLGQFLRRGVYRPLKRWRRGTLRRRREDAG